MIIYKISTNKSKKWIMKQQRITYKIEHITLIAIKSWIYNVNIAR